MKTHAQSQKNADSSFQTKAKNQANNRSILQAYKEGTAQLAAEEEPTQLQENKTGLPDNLKSGVENLSGHSLDDVKVHYNSSQPASLQAHAYAQGTDIHVAPGQEKHLPHEAWHVVQQKQGRVKPTKQLKGTTNINDDTGLEKEADVMGARALSLNTHVSQLKCDKCEEENQSGSTAQLSAVIQLYEECSESTHATTLQHKWVADQYIGHFGGVREFSVTNKDGNWNFIDVVDKEEIYEIKPKGKGDAGKNKAEEEAAFYVDLLNGPNGCTRKDGKKYKKGRTFDKTWTETGLGVKLTAWSPASGVLLYTQEDA